jgi:Tfp pilus assembly protein PilX
MNMGNKRQDSRGFTLIAALLVMILLSGVAAGLLFMVGSEARMGGNDLEDNLAYYGAESGMEKLTADLSSLYETSMSPNNTQIQNLINFPPTAAMVGDMNYTESISYTLNANGSPVSGWNTVSSGSNQGLYAEIVPMSLQVIASRPGGASVNMTRKVEIALIPVFQFGVFCGYDCSYFAGPNFAFGGRVHTNGNLFLAEGGGSDLVFDDKVAAFGQILTDELENGYPTATDYAGTVYAPKASGGCALVFPPTGSNCVSFPTPSTVPGDASWSGGYPSVGGAANSNFATVSGGTFNGYLTNSLTGATNMQLPFVQDSCTSNPPPCTDPIQILRKPLVGALSTTTLAQSQLYYKAQIRVLLADTVADLHPERGLAQLDAQDVHLYSAGYSSYAIPGVGTQPFAMGSVANGQIAPLEGSGTPIGFTPWPLLGEVTTNPVAANGAWIRVEYLNNSGVWVGVTTEWLGLGFGRAFDTMITAPNGGGSGTTNTVNPKAVLILQQLKSTSVSAPGASTDWYPINFYDTREGEMRDNANGCAVNGIMNAAEIDVGNLALWLKGTIGTSGPSVNFTNQNGYVLYFSDHRGMLPSLNPSNGGQTPAGVINGESGLEDVVNSTQGLTSTTPDGVKEAAVYYSYSPEDVDQNGFLDNWGGKNIGYGFNVNTNTTPPNPYLTTSCNTTGLANAVTGARHVVKLVDGSIGNLPTQPVSSGCTLNAANPTGCGGFTVASENPVYVAGNYNSSAADPYWPTGPSNAAHSAGGIIADSVTLLSNSWSDVNSLNNPTTLGNRNATTTYYRMAVAGGKNIPFPEPAFASACGSNCKDFGTDGGMHNFLRYLENWGGQTLNYNGSLVSVYYSEYNTGNFKCCSTVYSPPSRNFSFDTLFLNPSNLPPGTPMFQDVVNLSYHQNFTPQ